MRGTQVLGIVLIVLGILALIYGGFTYTQETHDVEIGPVELQVQEKERVNVPLWAGIAVLALGVVLVAVGPRR